MVSLSVQDLLTVSIKQKGFDCYGDEHGTVGILARQGLARNCGNKWLMSGTHAEADRKENDERHDYQEYNNDTNHLLVLPPHLAPNLNSGLVESACLKPQVFCLSCQIVKILSSLNHLHKHAWQISIIERLRFSLQYSPCRSDNAVSTQDRTVSQHTTHV